ncbi:nitrite reductase (NO-forming) [Sanguibacter gelidistatuariae]|uniref:Copper-containing nitrite reductase n=1 Tax=Sanguibacter gelidistatuariae TaxID=1814289 RepID=A0A1G6QJE5_9MICO|nr:multicopper oxidase domain-containing protein [Sanguibacter gelidistatuariae]SDC92291.1 nitrite reductase (NO-forming) [Sanguibacter gelidistatuariae]
MTAPRPSTPRPSTPRPASIGLRPTSPPPTGSRTAWHLRANLPTAFWLLATFAVALGHRFVPEGGWLLVHMLLLGAVTNAILVWSAHFADALLHRPVTVASRRWQVARIALLNAGIVVVIAGVLTATWQVTAVGATGVGAAVAAHGAVLGLQSRRALPSRFTSTITYYVTACMLLPVGAALGALLSAGLDDRWHNRVVFAHVTLNLLGFVGLTVTGTLMTLWPTILRTKIADGAERAARRGLVVLLVSLSVLLVGALTGQRLIAGAGVLGYAAGLVTICVPLVAVARVKPPTSYAAWSVAAGVTWLLGSLLTLVVIAAIGPTWSDAAAHVGLVTSALVAGFAAQVLLGALSYLLPVVLGGGPGAVRATSAAMDRAAPIRLILINGGLALCVLPVPSLVRVLASMLVLVGFAFFVGCVVSILRLHRARSRAGTASPALVSATTPAERVAAAAAAPPPARRTGLVGVAIGALVLAVVAGVSLDPAALGIGKSAAGAVAATGETTTVQVEARDMRFFPDSVDVPVGNTLIIELTNVDTQVHDLALDTGATSGRLSPGATARIEAGVIGRTVDGWCTVIGHRQMGMVFTVNVVGADGQPLAEGDGAAEGGAASGTGDGMDGEMDHSTMPGGEAAASAADDLDFMRKPAADFRARDAALAPARADGGDPSSPATHAITLTVSETVTEVAPGVTQKLWTFGGTAPGPTLHGKIGDTFDVTLVNDGTIGHSIDFHAGALAPDQPMRTIAPGESLTYRFTATRAGIWMYHCSTMPMSAHIANGMFGAVIIDPEGLAPVDREYVLVQSEFYLGPQGGEVDTAKIAAETPDIVAFNGYANQYDVDPLTARVGERVRVWVLAAGPSRGTSFHVVGGQFDTVFLEGAYTLQPGTPSAVAGGGAQALGLTTAQGGFVELEFGEAGTYPFVSHSMVDAERGAHGLLKVTD